MTAGVLINQILYGLALGMVYALVASGLSIVFGLMNVKNFAHGTLYMLGAYVTLWVGKSFGLTVGLLAAALAVALTGLIIEGVVLRPLYGRPLLDPFLATFGVTYILVEVVRLIWGDEIQSMPVPAIFNWSLDVAGAAFPVYRLFIIVAGALLLLAVWAALRFTRFGLLVQAATYSADLVNSLGVDVRKIFRWTFVGGAVLAAIAGGLIAPLSGLEPHMGVDAMVTAIVVVIVGGIGSLGGAILAGLLIGLVTALSIGLDFLQKLQMIPVYAVLIVILIWRPYGLMGRPD